jgi:membrane protein
MLISPVLVLMSGSATVFITTQVTQITQKVELLGVISPLISFLLKFSPYVLIWALFTILYIIMPNTKVNFKAGLLGGVVAGTLYQIAQWAYISFQISAAKYNAIYGSFAALPLFLMWLQISWWIVLFGAELSFANQNVHTYE